MSMAKIEKEERFTVLIEPPKRVALQMESKQKTIGYWPFFLKKKVDDQRKMASTEHPLRWFADH